MTKEVAKDAQGNVISTTSHAYDANGDELNPVTTFANGTVSGYTYTYDALGRIASMLSSEGGSQLTQGELAGFSNEVSAVVVGFQAANVAFAGWAAGLRAIQLATGFGVNALAGIALDVQAQQAIGDAESLLG